MRILIVANLQEIAYEVLQRFLDFSFSIPLIVTNGFSKGLAELVLLLQLLQLYLIGLGQTFNFIVALSVPVFEVNDCLAGDFKLIRHSAGFRFLGFEAFKAGLGLSGNSL